MKKKFPYWKSLIGLTTLLMVLYTGVTTLLWVQQAHFIFEPKRIITRTPADYELTFRDIFIPVDSRNGETERIHAWWIPADHPGDRFLLYFHGSALNIEANISHAQRFYSLGFSVLLVSYRGYGRSDGNFPTEAQIYADSHAAWNYMVEEIGADPGFIFVYGHSLGGAVAIQLAEKYPLAGGLIVEAAFTSIADMARRMPKYRFFPLELIVHQRFDSIERVNRLQVPVLYIHGTEDKFVPHAMSRQLYQRTASQRQLKLIRGGGHNNSAAVGEDEYLRTVRNFVELIRNAA